MIKKIISILIAFILIATLLINGSYFFDLLTYRLDFSHSEIYVSVGETLDLNTFIKDYEKAPSDIKYESSNAQVGHILENKFIALEKGETTVSAKCKNKKAYMKIISAYDEITSLQIHTDTDKAIRIFDIDEMEFVVQTDDNAQPSANILWSINGVNSSITGPNFYYTPTKIGRYVVKAEATDYNVSAQYEFVVYGQNTTTQFSFSGQLEQQNEYAPVIFSIDELSNFALVEWFVNGEMSKQVIAQDTSNAGFEFYPSKAGIYDITCKVNGKEISNASLNDVVIKAYGKMPIENLRIDYDSSYPNIYVEWDAPIGSGEYVIDIDGIQYSSITHHDKFYENKFDATGILDVFVPQNVKLTYKGDNVFASASAEINHTALKINALSYLSKQYLSGNYYMTSDQEVYDIFAYAMTFRPDEYSSTINSKACTEVNLKLYMAYSSEYSPSQLTENAWQMASQTGSYYLDTKGSTSKNNIYQIKISFVTTNIPENFSTLGKIKYDSINYPHVANNDYDGNYPIDSYPLSFDKVSSTEELYYVVNAGYKPNLQENSTAQQIYQQARDVLDCIISDDMIFVKHFFIFFRNIFFQFYK